MFGCSHINFSYSKFRYSVTVTESWLIHHTLALGFILTLSNFKATCSYESFPSNHRPLLLTWLHKALFLTVFALIKVRFYLEVKGVSLIFLFPSLRRAQIELYPLYLKTIRKLPIQKLFSIVHVLPLSGIVPFEVRSTAEPWHYKNQQW